MKSNPLPGFYKNGSGASAQYIQCKNYGYCEVATIGSGDCSSSNKGVLTKNSNNKYVLCLGDFAPPQEAGAKSERADSPNTFPSLEFLDSGSTESGNYLVQHVPVTGTTENVFSFDKSANFYAVKRDVNSIVFDSTDAEDKAVLYSDGKLIDRQNELCDIGKSSGRYYTCTKGICKSTKKTSKANDYEDNGDSKRKVLKFLHDLKNNGIINYF